MKRHDVNDFRTHRRKCVGHGDRYPRILNFLLNISKNATVPLLKALLCKTLLTVEINEILILSHPYHIGI